MAHLDSIMRMVGKNLVDSAHGIVAHIKPDGTIQNPTSYNLKCSDYIEVEPSTQYTYSGMGNVSSTSVSRTGYLYDANKNPIQQVSNSTGEAVRFTTTAATKYVVMQWHNTATAVQLEKGENATSYEPYAGEPKNIGGIPGKNLLDPNNLERGRYDDSGNKASDESCFRTKKLIQVKPSTEYTFQWSGSIASNVVRIIGFDSDGRFISLLQKSTLQSSTVTTPANCTQLGISLGNTATSMQLEQGSTATAYEPYKEHSIWQRAVAKESTKGVASAFDNTRMAKNYISVSNTGPVGWATLRNTDYLGVFNSLKPGTYTISYKVVLNSRDDVTDNSQKGWFVSGTVTGLAIDTRTNWGNVGVGVPVSESKTFTITQETAGKFDNVYLYGCGRGGIGKTGEATFYDIVLTEGSTAEPYYPYFSPAQVLPSAKAYGKAISATVQEELWGRYVPVEYIGSEGPAYLNTGVDRNNIVFEVDVQFISSANRSLFGYGANAGNYFGKDASNHPELGGGVSILTIDASQRHIYKYWNDGTNGNLEVEGETISRQGGYSSPNSFVTMVPSYSGASHLYGLKVLDGTTLLRDMVPVKDTATNTYGMWDRVEKKFYGNVGTGAFTAGGEIKRIDYLESHGAEYIDTGIKGNQNTEVDINYQAVSFGDPSRARLFGATDDTTFTIKAVAVSLIYSSQKQLGVGFGNDNLYTGQNTNDSLKHNIKLSKANITYDGNIIKPYSSISDFTTSGNMYLFGVNGLASTTVNASLKIYNTTLRDNGTLVRHFVPVKIGTTGYLLDTVEWKLYANVSGTGAFTCGPEIPNRLIVPYTLNGHRGEIKTTKFNQLVNYVKGDPTATTRGITFTNNNNGSFTFTGTCNQQVSFNFSKRDMDIVAGHKYLYDFDSFPSGVTVRVYSEPTTYIASSNPGIFTAAVDGQSASACLIIPVNVTLNQTVKPMLFDLTQMFGEGNEPTTIAEARKAIANVYGAELDYYPYTTGTVKVYAEGEHDILLGTQGVVDLGTLTWAKGYFGTNSFSAALSGVISATTQIGYMQGYNYKPYSSRDDKHWTVSMDGQYLIVMDSDYATAAEFKSAVTGKQFFYQRTTDTEYVAPITKQVQDLLYSATSYKDLQTGEVWRDWGIKVLDGTETGWDKNAVTNFYRIPHGSIGAEPNVSCWCSHFVHGNLYNVGEFSNGGTFINFNMTTNITNTNEWKAWLAEQKANGTPVIMIYPLATPTTESGTADAFRLTTKGNKTITTDVAGTTVQVRYLGE